MVKVREDLACAKPWTRRLATWLCSQVSVYLYICRSVFYLDLCIYLSVILSLYMYKLQMKYKLIHPSLYSVFRIQRIWIRIWIRLDFV